jgi:hypothetical protein
VTIHRTPLKGDRRAPDGTSVPTRGKQTQPTGPKASPQRKDGEAQLRAAYPSMYGDTKKPRK